MEVPLNVGIVGTDSTHFNHFLKLLPSLQDNLSIEVKGVFDLEETANYRAYKGVKGSSENFFDSLLASSDMLLILNRFPENNFRIACAAIEHGCGVFIDKPIFSNSNEAAEFCRLVDGLGSFVSYGSALKYCREVSELKLSLNTIRRIQIEGPGACNDMGNDPRYSDVGFYGVHLIEIALEFLDVESLKLLPSRASHKSTMVDKSLQVDLIIEDKAREHYRITAEYETGFCTSLDISLDGSYFEFMFQEVLIAAQTLDGPAFATPRLLKTMQILDAIRRERCKICV